MKTTKEQRDVVKVIAQWELNDAVGQMVKGVLDDLEASEYESDSKDVKCRHMSEQITKQALLLRDADSIIADLQRLCGESYQAAGAVGAPERWLDNLSAKAEREAHAATRAELAWWKMRYRGMADQYCEESGKVLSLNTALGVAEESLATAERDRERWMAVHDREWDVEVYPSGECSIFDPKDKSGKLEIVDSGPTLEAALDAAFARFPLEKK